ncbi:MAG: Thiosulfate sulfurtransferase PspE precursor [Bacteroidota bacterium]|jgi:rhodanese-related sulfurtransferase
MFKAIPKTLTYALIAFFMFGIFKTLFSQGDSEGLRNALQKKALLVDVRTPGEFASGSVPGSVNIPLDRVEQSLSRFKGHETVVVFCRSGMRSSQALDILQRNGIKEVVNGGSWEKVRDAKASLSTKK